MNETNITEASLLSPAGYLVTGVYVMIVGLTGTIGNITVILVILKYWSRTNISRKPHLPMTLSLAISDLGITFFGYPYTSISGYAGRWMFDDNVCRMVGFSCFFLSMSSLDVLVAISCYRYISICRPELKRHLGYRTTAWILVGCWLYAFIWSAPPLFGISGYTYEPFGTACSMDWDSKRPIDIAFLIGTDIFCFLVHLIILIFCYTKIFLRYRYLRSPEDANLGKTVMNREMRVTWMSFATVMVFVVVWAPYAVVCTWMVFSDTFPEAYSTLPTMFAKSSCAFNPILYGAFDKQFRQVAKRIMCPWMFRHVKPSQSHGGYIAKYPREESMFCTTIPHSGYETPDVQLKTISSGFLQAGFYTNSERTRFDFDKYRKKRNNPEKCVSSASDGEPRAIPQTPHAQIDTTSKATFKHHPKCSQRIRNQKETPNLQSKSLDLCLCKPDLNIEGLSIQVINSENMGSLTTIANIKDMGDKRIRCQSLGDESLGHRRTSRLRLKTKSLSLSNMSLKLQKMNSIKKQRKYSLDESMTCTELVRSDDLSEARNLQRKASSTTSDICFDVIQQADYGTEQTESQPIVAKSFPDPTCIDDAVSYLWNSRKSVGVTAPPYFSKLQNKMNPKTLPLTTDSVRMQQVMKRSYNLCNDNP